MGFLVVRMGFGCWMWERWVIGEDMVLSMRAFGFLNSRLPRHWWRSTDWVMWLGWTFPRIARFMCD